MGKRAVGLPVLLVAALFPLGCAGLAQTGAEGQLPPDFLSADAQTPSVRKDVSKPDVPPPDVLYLAPVELAPSCADTERNRNFARIVRRVVYDRLLLAPRNSSILMTKASDALSYRELGKRVYKIELSLTELQEGNGLLRYLVGFGLGAAVLGIQGRVVDMSHHEPILLFSGTEKSAGEPHLGMNPRVLYAEHCLRLAADRFALRLVDTLEGYL